MPISIILPTLHEAALIGSAVERAWALLPLEVLVVDGGSHDETVSIAEHHGAQVFSSAQGRAVQQNLGARHAKGDVLLFLHADTWLEPQAALQIETALADRKNLHGAFYQKIEATGPLYRLLERGNGARVTWIGLPYGDQGLFVRRQVFEQHGGFPEEPLMEDLLLARSLRKQARPVLLPGPLHVSARRWQAQGPVRQTLRNGALLLAERLGVEPSRLVRWYRPHGEP